MKGLRGCREMFDGVPALYHRRCGKHLDLNRLPKLRVPTTETSRVSLSQGAGGLGPILCVGILLGRAEVLHAVGDHVNIGTCG